MGGDATYLVLGDDEDQYSPWRPRSLREQMDAEARS